MLEKKEQRMSQRSLQHVDRSLKNSPFDDDPRLVANPLNIHFLSSLIFYDAFSNNENTLSNSTFTFSVSKSTALAGNDREVTPKIPPIMLIIVTTSSQSF